MAGQPSAEIAEASRLFRSPAKTDHDRDIAGFAIGDAEASDKITLDAHALERGGEEAAATMNDENFMTLLRQARDLPGQGANGGVVFE